jgi:hypothetical protein
MVETFEWVLVPLPVYYLEGNYLLLSNIEEGKEMII